MILDGFKFSINFLKDNFRKLITIISIPIILEVLLNSFNTFLETDEGFTAVYLVTNTRVVYTDLGSMYAHSIYSRKGIYKSLF